MMVIYRVSISVDGDKPVEEFDVELIASVVSPRN